MIDNCIEISGITSSEYYPKDLLNLPCKQICETDKLILPKSKSDIESICQVFGNISVCSYDIIKTPLGKKLVIKGKKHIKMLYVGKEPCQTMYCTHFDIPFCTFILLGDIDCEIAEIFTALEYIDINQLDNRSLLVSEIVFLCPIFNKC